MFSPVKAFLPTPLPDEIYASGGHTRGIHKHTTLICFHNSIAPGVNV